MSAAPKTSVQEIRRAARRLLEEEGLDGVSMQSVASRVGVQAPSLYKRFASRAELLEGVTEDALADLRAAIEPLVSPGEAKRSLRRIADAYRAFARQNPQAYRLIFTANTTSNLDARLAAAAPLLRILREELGEPGALPAARTLVAFLHGFITMEQGGLFQFGGNIDEAFQFGMTTILDALIPDSPGSS
jgi:AcrR family transcriptional regulator